MKRRRFGHKLEIEALRLIKDRGVRVAQAAHVATLMKTHGALPAEHLEAGARARALPRLAAAKLRLCD